MHNQQVPEDKYYHVYNRGVEKRDVFLNNSDYHRFLYLLFACNDTAQLLNSQFHYRGPTSIVNKERDQLVDIICFCLMPNHYHLILKPRKENGMPLFMQKIGTGYTMYFNTKRQRSGVLFQGGYKSILIDNEGYLSHLTRYIHLNPAELIEPKWKKVGILKAKETHKFVKEYKWSSYRDYLNTPHFPHLLNVELIKELFLPKQEYESFVHEWLVDNINLLGRYTLED
ncbi:MAG: transposase [Candidatus Sungiibacteriota bacterium]|uniref:Transposase n=1 Tax=Candidatus Sungiibacteriota bacterium TaxID=2750080 RepID=A0A7T5UQU8_9BACT|nr:MAG: transposase [Candidatus Sungbacteria bacterium]